MSHEELATRLLVLGQTNPKQTPVEKELANIFDDLLLRVAGATGVHVGPPINEHDEGQLAVLLKPTGDKLVIEFGKPLTFVALGADDAIKFAMAVGGWGVGQKERDTAGKG